MDIVHSHCFFRTITISAHDLDKENVNRLINHPIYIPGICCFHFNFLFNKAFKLGKRPLLKGKIYCGYIKLNSLPILIIVFNPCPAVYFFYPIARLAEYFFPIPYKIGTFLRSAVRVKFNFGSKLYNSRSKTPKTQSKSAKYS